MKAAVAAILLLACAHQAGADQVERRAPADPSGEVEIGNVAGDVQVRGWDRAEVQVTAALSEQARLAFERDGRRTVIKVLAQKGGDLHCGCELTVHVPSASALTVNTVSADQTISAVRGAQRLQAVSGNITTEVWNEEFEIKTASGDVSVHGHGGTALARVTTISGDLRLEDTGSELELVTVTGDLRIRLEQLVRGRIKSTNGDTTLEAHLPPQARVEAEAVNGDLRFFLRGSVDAQVDIETFNGDIDTCFGAKPRRVHEHGPGNELRFTEGAGSARLRVKTFNGNVEVCKK